MWAASFMPWVSIAKQLLLVKVAQCSCSSSFAACALGFFSWLISYKIYNYITYKKIFKITSTQGQTVIRISMEVFPLKRQFTSQSHPYILGFFCYWLLSFCHCFEFGDVLSCVCNVIIFPSIPSVSKLFSASVLLVPLSSLFQLPVLSW